jgi:hypothetical protein
MITESKHALFLLGFSSEVDSSTYKKSIFNLTYIVNAQPTGVYFRVGPNKPLPANVGSNQSRLPIAPHQSFKWAIIDFVVTCLFLGIPYIMIFNEHTRHSSRIIDEESGLRYAIPTLVIGACTCLVVNPLLPSLPPLLSKNRPSLSLFRKAAVVLSASVTFKFLSAWTLSRGLRVWWLSSSPRSRLRPRL